MQMTRSEKAWACGQSAPPTTETIRKGWHCLTSANLRVNSSGGLSKSTKSPRAMFGCAVPIGGSRLVRSFFDNIASEPIRRLKFVWLRLGRRGHLRLLCLAHVGSLG